MFNQEKKMKVKRLPRTIIVLSVVALFAALACAQRPAQSTSTGAVKSEGTKATFKGKIGYMNTTQTYMIRGEDPPDEVFIVNENPKVLEELMKSGKTVTIEGHYTIGADHFFIEKIDGKPYHGKQ